MSRMESALARRPRLVSGFRKGATSVFVGDSHEVVAHKLPVVVLERTLRRFDGETSLAQIVDDEPELSSSVADELYETLDVAGLIDDAAPASFRSGRRSFWKSKNSSKNIATKRFTKIRSGKPASRRKGRTMFRKNSPPEW